MPAEIDGLIDDLAAELRPVRVLPRPAVRAALWLGVLALGGGLLASLCDLREVAARLMAAPDMWLSAVGSVATAILAALSACLLSVPGYSSRSAWLPAPGVALWLGASGIGCLRGLAIATLHPASWSEAAVHCLPFILKISLVLAVPLAVLLWWARPLRPGLVAMQGGLAVAAGSASLLWFIHPFDASYEDLVVHALAVLLVVAICRVAALMPPARARASSRAG